MEFGFGVDRNCVIVQDEVNNLLIKLFRPLHYLFRATTK